MRVGRRVLQVLVGAAVVALLLATGAVRQRLAAPVHVGDTPRMVDIKPGTPFARVAHDLAADGGYPYPHFLVAYGRWRGAAEHVQAGEYAIAGGTSVSEFVDALIAGEVVQYSLTVVEGWTSRQFFDAVRAQPKLAQTLAGQTAAEIMTQLGHLGQHPEGRFFPDTYSFSRGGTDKALLARAYEAMSTRVASVWEKRADGLPLKTAEEALALASIIEKETARDDERAKIAGVFVRRLKRGMRLQTDPTVIYGLGESFDGNLTRRDLRTDTPYNTYTRAGLPPTPIALPGMASLLAAVQPEDGSALYFVATGESDGGHYFSATLAEHERAVGRYLARVRGRK